MIKFFRKIRQKLLSEDKFRKYLVYALGEIILIVLGILIALSLNNWNENRAKSKLKYTFLVEMSDEFFDDAHLLANTIKRLKQDLEQQEAALNTKSLSGLSIDSLEMIINSTNLDINLNELTFKKMINLGITELSDDEFLNTRITNYYNFSLDFFKRARDYLFDDLKKFQNNFLYEQNTIDLYLADDQFRFPALYKQTEEEILNLRKEHLIDYLYSPKGRNLVLNQLSKKRYAMEVFQSIQSHTAFLYYLSYNEIKKRNPDTPKMLDLPEPFDFQEIELPVDSLNKFIGEYELMPNFIIKIFKESNQMKAQGTGQESFDIFPNGQHAFFAKVTPLGLSFKKGKNGEIDRVIILQNGKETTAKKLSQ